jgi:hypothetical protein
MGEYVYMLCVKHLDYLMTLQMNLLGNLTPNCAVEVSEIKNPTYVTIGFITIQLKVSFNIDGTGPIPDDDTIVGLVMEIIERFKGGVVTKESFTKTHTNDYAAEKKAWRAKLKEKREREPPKSILKRPSTSIEIDSGGAPSRPLHPGFPRDPSGDYPPSTRELERRVDKLEEELLHQRAMFLQVLKLIPPAHAGSKAASVSKRQKRSRYIQDEVEEEDDEDDEEEDHGYSRF